MSKNNQTNDNDDSVIYEIRLKGHLDQSWASWFEGLDISLEETGETILRGRIIDQAALHGLLKKVRDIGLPLLSVNHLGSKQKGSGASNNLYLSD